MQGFALNVTVVAVFFGMAALLRRDHRRLESRPKCSRNATSWQAAYSAVIAEHDLAEFSAKIDAALSECEQRRLTPGNAEEAEGIAEAEVLRMLQTERLGSSPAVLAVCANRASAKASDETCP